MTLVMVFVRHFISPTRHVLQSVHFFYRRFVGFELAFTEGIACSEHNLTAFAVAPRTQVERALATVAVPTLGMEDVGHEQRQMKTLAQEGTIQPYVQATARPGHVVAAALPP